MTPARYRGLRGWVRHVLRNTKCLDGGVASRKPAWGIGYRGVYGTCTWCGLPALSRKGRKLKWHGQCARYHAVAVGAMTFNKSWRVTLVVERAACICGAPGTELDHRLAIGVAARLTKLSGRNRPYALAFLPDNLWWLCHDCHTAKTRFDRAWMRNLDGKDPERTAVKPVQFMLENVATAGQTSFLAEAESGGP